MTDVSTERRKEASVIGKVNWSVVNSSLYSTSSTNGGKHASQDRPGASSNGTPPPELQTISVHMVTCYVLPVSLENVGQ